MRNSTKRRRRAIRIFLTKICIVEACILICMILLYRIVAGGKIYKKVIIQAGTEITMDLFKKKEKYESEFVTDISQIQTKEPGEYQVEIKLKNKTYKSKLKIVDTTKPKADAAPQTVYNGESWA